MKVDYKNFRIFYYSFFLFKSMVLQVRVDDINAIVIVDERLKPLFQMFSSKHP
jgi:hypothetical protein